MADKGGLLGRLSSAFRRKEKVDLVVGLDFGTSSTKAAYRELGSTARKVIPIVFNHGLATYPPYCLPSVGHLSKEGRLLWGPDAVRKLEYESWSSGIRRLKVLVAGQQDTAFRDEGAAQAYNEYVARAGLDPTNYRPEHLIAVAIAKQMHLVRRILGNSYPGVEIDIRFNVCVPIDQMERPGIMEVYHRINHVADEMYRSGAVEGWGDTELVDVAASGFEDASTQARADGRLFAMPEAMAEIASYLVSLEMGPGIHAVIDIGSGTTDLSIFNLVGPSQNDRDCYWYAARNVPRGAGYVEAAVAGVLKATSANTGVITEAKVLQALSTAAPRTGIGDAIYDELHVIWNALRPTWVKAYGRHYKRESAWDGIPVFACGGGARLLGVKKVFAKAWVPNFNDFTVRDLPVPDDYDDRKGSVPFDRLSVAYGLTFLSPELGTFSLPADSPDHTPILRFKEFPMPWSDMEPG